MISTRAWMYLVPVLAIAALAGGLRLVSGGLGSSGAGDGRAGPLVFLCDEAFRPAVAGEDLEHGGGIVELFLRRTGERIDTRYAAGTDLLDHLRETGRGDLLLAGDGALLARAEREGLVERTYHIADLAPVILVRRDLRDSIRAVADLADPELRLAVAAPEASEIGAVTEELLHRHGVSLDAHARLIRAGPTAMDLARRVQFGEADAAVVWRPVATQFPRNTAIVDLPEDANTTVPLRVAVLTTSDRPDDARRVAEFMTGSAVRELLRRYYYLTDLGHGDE